MFERPDEVARALAQTAAAPRRLNIATELAAKLPRDIAVVIEGEGLRLLVRRLPERAVPSPEPAGGLA